MRSPYAFFKFSFGGCFVPLSLISLQLLGRDATMGTTRRSFVSRAFTMSQKVGMRDRVFALVVKFGGSMERVAVVFVTLFVS